MKQLQRKVFLTTPKFVADQGYSALQAIFVAKCKTS